MSGIILSESLGSARAHGTIVHARPTRFEVEDGKLVGKDYVELSREEIWNLITNVGRVQLHTQCYGTSGLLTNGFNYIALSNDTLTETGASTTLSNEISTNGLQRALGTVTLASGSGTSTTIAKTFTASGAQAAQKAALFTAASVGVMNHVLAFTQRSLLTLDTLAITFTITLGA